MAARPRSAAVVTAAAVLVVMLASAVPVSAEDAKVLVEDKLTKPGKAFEVRASDVTSKKFSKAGMRVQAKEPGKGIQLEPAFDATNQEVLNIGVQASVASLGKETGVGVYCRETDAREFYLFLYKDNTVTFFKQTSEGLQKLAASRAKFKKGSNTIRGECVEEAPGSLSLILRAFVNGKEVASQLDTTRTLGPGAAGIYLEGQKNTKGTATFKNLKVAYVTPT